MPFSRSRKCQNLRETGDIEDFPDLGIRAHQVHRAAVLANALQAADQHAKAGGVDVAHILEVDHQRVMTLIDELAQRFFHLLRRIDVDLAVELDDAHGLRTVNVAHIDFYIHYSCSRLISSAAD